MPSQTVSDASFYAIVNHLLKTEEPSPPVCASNDQEQRHFTSLQWVAPYRDGRLPAEAEFEQILCEKISITGLSYLAAQPPATRYQLIALGQGEPLFVSAAVSCCEPVNLAGADLYLVTCQFVARVLDTCYGPLAGNPPAYADALLETK